MTEHSGTLRAGLFLPRAWRVQWAIFSRALAADLAAMQSEVIYTRLPFLSSLSDLRGGLRAHLAHFCFLPSLPFFGIFLRNFLPVSLYRGKLLLRGPPMRQIVFWILIFRIPYKHTLTYAHCLVSPSAVLHHSLRFIPLVSRPWHSSMLRLSMLTWNLAFRHIFKTISN